MRYFIGIDGGGTKTAAIIQSEDGREAVLTLPGSNNSYVGVEASVGIVKSAIEGLAEALGAELGEIAGVFVGIAGATANDYINICEAALQEMLPNAKVGVNVDAQNLLAMLDGDGAALICGTGSICFARKDGVLHRIGGYADFDPYGSGTHIGKAALMLSLYIHDGRRELTSLYASVEAKLGASVLPSLPKLMKAERSYIASFAPLVFTAAENGDKNALEILNKNFAYLAELVDRASQILGTDSFPLVAGGGIMRDELSQNLLLSMTKARVRLSYFDDQSRGALKMAKNLGLK